MYPALLSPFSQLIPQLIRRARLSPALTSAYNKVSVNWWNRRQFADILEHERMLADRERVDAYAAAIRKHVHAGDVVVDLGTGSGILAYLASLMQPRMIYALDHSHIIEKARVLAKRNGVTNIAFQSLNSRKFNCPEPVDVLIHEQMGAYLFNENMLANVLDLRDRLLKTGGRILPNRFELFVEPVQLRDAYRVPFLWELNLHGLKFDRIHDIMQSEMTPRRNHRLIHALEVDHLLTTAQPILSFDLETMKLDELPRRVDYERSVTAPGRMDGLAVYFRAMFDDENMLDTNPLRCDGRPVHWNTPLLRCEAREYAHGDVVRLSLEMHAHEVPNTWRWQVD
jgi:protein arginine N-methyltransferase 1